MMKAKRLFFNAVAAVFLCVILGVSVLLSVSVNASAAEVIMQPSARPAETERGTNLLANSDFSAGAITRLDPSSGWSLPAYNDLGNSGKSAENILSATQVSGSDLAPSAEMEGITNGLKLDFKGYNDPGDCLVYNGFGNIITGSISKFFYFSAWIKTSVDIYFDVSIDSNDAPVYDLGRRIKVSAADGWTQIGMDTDGHYYIFRTNAEIDEFGGTADKQYKMTTAAKYADKIGNDDSGEAYLARGGSSWTALKITTHSAASGYADNTGGLTSGTYYMTGVTFWAGEVVNKDEINELILEFDDMNEADYTGGSWAAYLEAYNDTCDIYFDVNAKTDAVDAAAEKLLKARAKLIKVADKIALNTEITEAKKLEAKLYTAASWSYFEYTLEVAEAVAADEGVSQSAVSAAVSLLKAAIDSLEPAGSNTALIVGLVAGGVVLLAAGAVLGVFFIKKSKKGKQEN